MTKSDPLQLPRLLSTAADKKLTAGGINKTIKKPANADPSRLELKLVFKQTDESRQDKIFFLLRRKKTRGKGFKSSGPSSNSFPPPQIGNQI
jgi:hypothetical protein